MWWDRCSLINHLWKSTLWRFVLTDSNHVWNVIIAHSTLIESIMPIWRIRLIFGMTKTYEAKSFRAPLSFQNWKVKGQGHIDPSILFAMSSVVFMGEGYHSYETYTCFHLTVKAPKISISMSSLLIIIASVYRVGAAMSELNCSTRVGSNQPGSVMWVSARQLKKPWSQLAKSYWQLITQWPQNM